MGHSRHSLHSPGTGKYLYVVVVHGILFMVTILQVVPRLDAGGSELATIEIMPSALAGGCRGPGRHRRRPYGAGGG